MDLDYEVPDTTTMDMMDDAILGVLNVVSTSHLRCFQYYWHVVAYEHSGGAENVVYVHTHTECDHIPGSSPQW